MLGADHPLVRAESQERTLRAQFAVTVVFGFVAALALAAARRGRAAAVGRRERRRRRASRWPRSSLTLRLRERAFELIASGREELPSAGRRERALAPARPPLPPQARAHDRRDRGAAAVARLVLADLRRPRLRDRRAGRAARDLAPPARAADRARPRHRARHAPDPRRRRPRRSTRAPSCACARSSGASATCSSRPDARPSGGGVRPAAYIGRVPASLEIPACSPDRVRELAAELGLQRVTAEVLVRRGLADAGRRERVPRQRGPAARSVRPRRHGGGLRADRERHRRGSHDRRPRRLRRRRRLRDGARGRGPAAARRRGRAVPAQPLRARLRRRAWRASRRSPPTAPAS